MGERSKHVVVSFIYISSVLVLPVASRAVTVINTNASGPGSLAEAADITPPGGTIDFAVSGSIVLDSAIGLFDVTLLGPGSANLTIIRSETLSSAATAAMAVNAAKASPCAREA